MECLEVTFSCLLMVEGRGSNSKLFGACTATGRHVLCPSSLGSNVISMFSSTQLAYTMAYKNCKEIHPLACVSRPMAQSLSWHMEDLDSNPVSRSQDPICLHDDVLLWKALPICFISIFLWERRCFGVNYTRRFPSMQTECRNAFSSQETLLDISCLLA